MATEVGSGTGYSPGAMGCSEMMRAILDYIQGTDDSHLIGVALRETNLAIDELNVRKWEKLATTQTISLTASDDEYELSDNFKDPLQARLLDSSDSRVKRLIFEPYRRFMELFHDRSSETAPDYYSIDYDRRLLLLQGPPSSSWVTTYPTLELSYYRRLAYLTCGSSTHGGPPEFNSFLIWRGRAAMAAIRGEVALSNAAAAKASALFRELRVSDTDIQTDWN